MVGSACSASAPPIAVVMRRSWSTRRRISAFFLLSRTIYVLGVSPFVGLLLDGILLLSFSPSISQQEEKRETHLIFLLYHFSHQRGCVRICFFRRPHTISVYMEFSLTNLITRISKA